MHIIYVYIYIYIYIYIYKLSKGLHFLEWLNTVVGKTIFFQLNELLRGYMDNGGYCMIGQTWGAPHKTLHLENLIHDNLMHDIFSEWDVPIV